MSYLVVSQWCVGVLFTLFGLLKVMDLRGFKRRIEDYDFGWASNAAFFIAAVELLLGVALLLGVQLQTMAMIALILTTVLTIIFGYGYFFKGVDDCGCAGTYFKIHPVISFLKNLLLIALCIVIYLNS